MVRRARPVPEAQSQPPPRTSTSCSFVLPHRVKMSGWKQPGCSLGTQPKLWWPKLSVTSHSLLGSTSEQQSWKRTFVPRSGFFGKVSLRGDGVSGRCLWGCGPQTSSPQDRVVDGALEFVLEQMGGRGSTRRKPVQMAYSA